MPLLRKILQDHLHSQQLKKKRKEKIKYLGINSTMKVEDLYNQKYKTLKKEIEAEGPAQ